VEETQEIREKALYLLSRREYSAKELAVKLHAKFDAERVDSVLAGLAEQGLQSDQRFASMLVRGRIGQGHGPIRIQMELKQKGISAEHIQQALVDNPVDWFEQARNAFQRRFGQVHASDMKLRAKQMRFLQYRGFNLDQIQYAMSAVSSE
jgi:regulatory protein